MTRMRAGKALFKEILAETDWLERLARLELPPKERVGPLMSLLPASGTLAGRAAAALGMSAAELARTAPEDARVLLRRFMWHMNEESGNLGWGIPESTAEACARSALLAGEFSRVLLSYIRNTGREDNFVDHAPLRRACFWAAGRLLEARPELRGTGLPLVIAGLEDEDIPCRGMAAWALLRIGVPEEALPALRKAAADARCARAVVQIFDGHAARECGVAELIRAALERRKSAFP